MINRIALPRKILQLICLMFVAAFFSCNSGDSQNRVADGIILPESGAGSPALEEAKAIPPEKKIIKEGNLRFETSNANETQKRVREIVAGLGGYIGNENTIYSDGIIEHALTARVPEDKFGLLVEKISAVAEKIESRNINSLDVTEEFIDVEARINTKKELEARYKEILNKAVRVDEILNIEREIGNLRSEIESLEGRMNYLKNRVSLSTLNITFYEKLSVPFGFFTKIRQALHNGWQALLWFIIILISLWPFLILILITLYVVLKYRRKRKV